MQSLAHTQLLLRNVWADNYHQFGEFIPDNAAFNFPPAQDLFTRNVDLSRLLQQEDKQAWVPIRFPDLKGEEFFLDSQSAHNVVPGPPPPPALPPKQKNRSSSLYCNKNKERIIPIVREADGSVVTPKRRSTEFTRESVFSEGTK